MRVPLAKKSLRGLDNKILVIFNDIVHGLKNRKDFYENKKNHS